MDYGNVEGTYSENESEIVYESKIPTAITFMLCQESMTKALGILSH